MGLDIEAYKKMKKVAYPERDVDGGLVDWENLVEIDQSTLDYTEQYFKGRTQGLVAGVYSPDDSLRFRAGAYSYYNRFREKLENIASNSQLFELIIFSEREKLDEYDFETYLNFKKAFELASEEGCVQFM